MTDLFVATGSAVTRISGSNGRWTAVLSMEDSGAQCLARDPRNPKTLYAGTVGHGVWKSVDAGERWEDLHLPEKDVFSVAVSGADGAVYAGSEPSRLFRSRDGGAHWEEIASLQTIPSKPTWRFPPRPWTSHVRWIAPNPHDPALLLVGIELGGLMYSSDGGASWLDHRPGAQRDVHALAWHPEAPGRAYEAGGGGAAWSHDGGVNWEPADAGRDRNYTWGLAADPADPDCWYISANPGPDKAHRGGCAEAFIYRWRGNGPWQRLEGGLPQPLESFPYALAIGSGELYAGLGDGRIYASRDGGDSWNPLRIEGSRPDRVSAMVIGG